MLFTMKKDGIIHQKFTKRKKNLPKKDLKKEKTTKKVKKTVSK
jgi:hypothetical protein